LPGYDVTSHKPRRDGLTVN